MNDQPKIISRIFGGIGNQLFCYAAGRRLALINNLDFVIDSTSGFRYELKYPRHYQLDHFSIPCAKVAPTGRFELYSRLKRAITRTYNYCLPFSERSYVQEEGLDFDRRLLQLRPRCTLYLDGYWQSECYFKDIENTIRADLQIKPPRDETNLSMASRIRDSRAVAVHVRFFDTTNSVGLNNISQDYYTRAVARMESLVPGAHYFIFSDRPDMARSRIPLSDDRVTCVTNNQGDVNAYADLWLMTLCTHFIIANSTFSWWGAWLAEAEGKLVIAPGLITKQSNQTNTWGFKGLIPTEWMKM